MVLICCNCARHSESIRENYIVPKSPCFICGSFRTRTYHLISLANFFLFGKWNNKDDMYHDLVEDDKNGYQLIEVIPFNKLELKRINAEKKD